jgi:hypothetical protein
VPLLAIHLLAWHRTDMSQWLCMKGQMLLLVRPLLGRVLSPEADC